jgi:hypothetical protein
VSVLALGCGTDASQNDQPASERQDPYAEGATKDRFFFVGRPLVSIDRARGSSVARRVDVFFRLNRPLPRLDGRLAGGLSVQGTAPLAQGLQEVVRSDAAACYRDRRRLAPARPSAGGRPPAPRRGDPATITLRIPGEARPLRTEAVFIDVRASGPQAGRMELQQLDCRPRG